MGRASCLHSYTYIVRLYYNRVNNQFYNWLDKSTGKCYYVSMNANTTNTTQKILIITRDGTLDTDYIKAKQASIRRTKSRIALQGFLSRCKTVFGEMGNEILLDIKIDYYDTCKGTNLKETRRRQDYEERLRLLKASAGIVDRLS
jgi:hypothetical protein